MNLIFTNLSFFIVFFSLQGEVSTWEFNCVQTDILGVNININDHNNVIAYVLPIKLITRVIAARLFLQHLSFF